jgi:lysyl-tRNA synthetase class 2
MPRPLEELRKERLKKLEKIRALGFNPYLSFFEREHLISQVREAKLGTKAVVAGRIMAWREHGKIVFADLVDQSAKIQILFRSDKLSDTNLKLLALLDIGDFIGVVGKTFKTDAGELTIEAEDLVLLTKSLRSLPAKSGLENIEERYRKRYLDLVVNPEIRKIFETRTQIVTELRRYMDGHGFIEVETPVLQPVYGGASARPFVTHHNSLDADFYLRISDELYLKRLIAGGFEKVYEIGHVFRNEGIDRSHNPEFTMMEFYWAFSDYEGLMGYTEEMLTSVIKKVNGSLKIKYQGDILDFTPPWPRRTYRDLLKSETGIDIDKFGTEAKLLAETKKKRIQLDLKGVVGYGALCDQLYKDVIRPKIVQPTYVTDYPAAMIALAKKKENDPSKIASFQLLVKGSELLKAYNELNDPIDQKERWLEEEKLGKKGLGGHMVVDEDYIEALEYGMPPTAGWGLGIDRLVAVLTDQHSIKDTILFPTLRPR